MSAGSSGIAWAFLSAGLLLVVILLAMGAALVVYQRRFVAMHRAYADGLLTAQEQERAWVAREVHDDALQRIMMLLHEIDDWSAGSQLPAMVRERLVGCRAELEDLSASLRNLAYHLHPSFVAQGLVPMLEHLASEVGRAAGLKVEVRQGVTPLHELTPEQSLVVYRIAQEALANVVRHSGTLWAVVEVGAQNGSVELSVEDYGAGFEPASLSRRGLGLISMTERARAAGGSLQIESHPRGGTRVHLSLPAKAAVS